MLLKYADIDLANMAKNDVASIWRWYLIWERDIESKAVNYEAAKQSV